MTNDPDGICENAIKGFVGLGKGGLVFAPALRTVAADFGMACFGVGFRAAAARLPTVVFFVPLVLTLLAISPFLVVTKVSMLIAALL
jgi:hypothetical protein